MQKLKSILRPPSAPVEVPSDTILTECEAKLGRLPDDYKNLLEIYGTGCIDKFIWIFNPAAKNPHLNLLSQIEKQITALRELNATGLEKVTYPMFPEPRGLLPFGITDNGDVLGWITRGKIQNWTVIVAEARSPRYVEADMEMTDFLALVLVGEIKVPFFPEDFPSANPGFEIVRL
jgi:hypothetical protein